MMSQYGPRHHRKLPACQNWFFSKISFKKGKEEGFWGHKFEHKGTEAGETGVLLSAASVAEIPKSKTKKTF